MKSRLCASTERCKVTSISMRGGVTAVTFASAEPVLVLLTGQRLELVGHSRRVFASALEDDIAYTFSVDKTVKAWDFSAAAQEQRPSPRLRFGGPRGACNRVWSLLRRHSSSTKVSLAFEVYVFLAF